MKHAKILLTLLLLTIIASQAFSEAFEEKKPEEEKTILVPKGARPVLREEYPRTQLVVDRIKARHTGVLIIPFQRSWNTAAITALTGTEIEENPEIGNDYELGFALHSQRMRMGSMRNKEYFQKETEGFPEGWYWPLTSEEYIDRAKGYMSTTFVHLAAKRMRRKYTDSQDVDYQDFADRIGGILNVVMLKKHQLTFMANRDMQNIGIETTEAQLPQRAKNVAGIAYSMPGEGLNKIKIDAGSTWSVINDSEDRDFRYISGYGSAEWGRDLRPDFGVEIKAKSQILTLRDVEIDEWDTREYGSLGVTAVISPSSFLKLKVKLAGLYDSEYEGYITPGLEIAITPNIVRFSVGLRKLAILPDHDEIYWPSKLILVNNDLKPESFWEVYTSLGLDIIARLRFLAEVTYSQPESRITWDQLPGYVWKPINVKTSEALKGEASFTINLVGSLSTFASFRYQHFDTQLFDPEISTTGGFSYGSPIRGSITLGASFWNFQLLEDAEPDNFTFAYLRINKTIRKVVNIFIDGRYTFEHDDVLYYRGMPQAGRIVSAGANIVFGGLD